MPAWSNDIKWLPTLRLRLLSKREGLVDRRCGGRTRGPGMSIWGRGSCGARLLLSNDVLKAPGEGFTEQSRARITWYASLLGELSVSHVIFECASQSAAISYHSDKRCPGSYCGH